MDNSGFASVKKWLVNNFSSPDRAPTCWRRVVAGRFHFGGASRPQLRWSTTASWVGDSVTAARGTLSKTTRALKPAWRGQMDSTTARLHSSSVSSDRDQPLAAWPRRRIWASLSNIGMTVGTVAPQALANNHDRWSPVSQSALFHA